MSKKPRLSKNLLQMKFMQRSNAQEDEEAAEVIQKTLARKIKTVRRGHAKITYRVEPSYVALDDLVFGRMSFQGFNPEVERWMAHYAALRKERLAKSVDRSMKKDVADEEVAASMSNVARTIGRKFAKKRHRSPEVEDDSEVVEERTNTVLRVKHKKRFRRPVDT